MRTNKIQRYQRALREWIESRTSSDAIAVTLTFKQAIKLLDGTYARLTDNRASSAVQHFLNVLEASLYPKWERRRGIALTVAAAREQGPDKRLHYHLIIAGPGLRNTPNLVGLIRKAWLANDWGYNQIDVQPCDCGWIDYLTKRKDKPIFDLGINYILFRPFGRKVS